MRTITVTGTTLFHVASEVLADATKWVRIAQLNAFSDPVLTGVVTLRIPDPDPRAGGGLGRQ